MGSWLLCWKTAPHMKKKDLYILYFFTMGKITEECRSSAVGGRCRFLQLDRRTIEENICLSTGCFFLAAICFFSATFHQMMEFFEITPYFMGKMKDALWVSLVSLHFKMNFIIFKIYFYTHTRCKNSVCLMLYEFLYRHFLLGGVPKRKWNVDSFVISNRCWEKEEKPSSRCHVTLRSVYIYI